MDNITATNPSVGIIKEPRISSKVTNTPLTQEELDDLKNNNLDEYLKAMMRTQAISIEKGSSSWTASGSRSTIETAGQLLQQIREQAFNVNMIQVLGGNLNSSYGIKNMLKKVDILNISPEDVDFVVELGFLLDQVSANLLHKQKA